MNATSQNINTAGKVVNIRADTVVNIEHGQGSSINMGNNTHIKTEASRLDDVIPEGIDFNKAMALLDRTHIANDLEYQIKRKPYLPVLVNGYWEADKPSAFFEKIFYSQNIPENYVVDVEEWALDNNQPLTARLFRRWTDVMDTLSIEEDHLISMLDDEDESSVETLKDKVVETLFSRFQNHKSDESCINQLMVQFQIVQTEWHESDVELLKRLYQDWSDVSHRIDMKLLGSDQSLRGCLFLTVKKQKIKHSWWDVISLKSLKTKKKSFDYHEAQILKKIKRMFSANLPLVSRQDVELWPKLLKEYFDSEVKQHQEKNSSRWWMDFKKSAVGLLPKKQETMTLGQLWRIYEDNKDFQDALFYKRPKQQEQKKQG